MNTIRTEEQYQDYFLNGLYELARARKKYVYAGHCHTWNRGINFETFESAGYQGRYEILPDNVYVIADLHAGLNETEMNVYKVLHTIESKPKGTIIFLGDTLEMVLCTDRELKKSYFYEWLNKTKHNCKFVRGNHDANLSRKDVNGFFVCDEYTIDSMLFIHGHQYDIFLKTLNTSLDKIHMGWATRNIWYYSWKLLDYANIPVKYVDNLLGWFSRGRE